MKLNKLILFFFISLCQSTPVYFGVFIGNNEGFAKEGVLEFAESDAKKVASTLNKGKRFDPENTYLLLDKSSNELDAVFYEIKGRIKEISKHSEVVFMLYYSGHGDSESFHLKEELFSKKRLFKHLDELNVELKIMVVDACESGGIIKKGVNWNTQKEASGIAKGEVFLSSSNKFESSYESSLYKGAIFTYHFVEALKGIGDYDKNRMVSLNEAFQYANFSTKREVSEKWGTTQNPSFNFDYYGDDEITLMDYSQSNNVLELRNLQAKQIKIIDQIKSNQEQIVFLDGRQSIFTYLESSIFQIQYEEKGNVYLSNVDFRVNKSIVVRPKDFQIMPKTQYSLRGKGFQNIKSTSYSFGYSNNNTQVFNYNEFLLGYNHLDFPYEYGITGAWATASNSLNFIDYDESYFKTAFSINRNLFNYSRFSIEIEAFTSLNYKESKLIDIRPYYKTPKNFYNEEWYGSIGLSPIFKTFLFESFALKIFTSFEIDLNKNPHLDPTLNKGSKFDQIFSLDLGFKFSVLP